MHWSAKLLTLATILATAGSAAPTSDLHCKVAIVGGGVGGLHTAFRLGVSQGSDVCLFEKDEQLGGRIHDVSLDEKDPNAPKFGTGARRVMETQTLLFDLAKELGITLETPSDGADLINARGNFSFTKDHLKELAYPTLPATPVPGKDHETWLYDTLRSGPERANAGHYPDFRSYSRAVIGSESYEFLRDVSRFRADFDAPIDARSYLDYLDEEWDTCCTPSYPIGGMSAFIRGMEAKARASGVQIFTAEAVNSINKAGTSYQLDTKLHNVSADKIVITVPPYGMNHIKGDVVERIRRQEQYKEIIGIKVVTIAQWWPENWWSELKNPGLDKNNQIWRVWTTESCINFIEIPLNKYAVDQKVTRSVYDDDPRCVEFWENTAKVSMAKVEEEIHRGLEHIFNNNGIAVPNHVDIPKPLKTHVQIWPDAWHWLRAGSTFTNKDIAEWALNPLPGEDVALVGEAYYINRSGWSDAAYKSSIRLLNTKYQMNLPTGVRVPLKN
ncbi:MAG: FAD-dependent oxidoreductase [Chitinophagaceae bacterium]|nr:FAD-dependent oxidoreductase [Oligoflexus sp.]